MIQGSNFGIDPSVSSCSITKHNHTHIFCMMASVSPLALLPRQLLLALC